MAKTPWLTLLFLNKYFVIAAVFVLFYVTGGFAMIFNGPLIIFIIGAIIVWKVLS